MPPLLVQNHLVKLCESIQELRSNDDSVTDNMLILVLQKFEEDKGLCLRNDDENDKTNEILYKKKDGSATDELLLLASQKSEEK